MVAPDPLHRLIAQWQAAASEAERRRCEDVLLAEARAVAMQGARTATTSLADVEDAAQVACLRFLTELKRGKERRSPSAYLCNIGKNCRRDLQRRSARLRGKHERASEHMANEQVRQASFERKVIEAETEHEATKLMKVLLKRLPASYRHVLQHVYIEGRPREELVAARYREMVATGDVDENEAFAVEHAKRKARNHVDARVSRAKAKLRLLLLEAKTEGTP